MKFMYLVHMTQNVGPNLNFSLKEEKKESYFAPISFQVELQGSSG